MERLANEEDIVYALYIDKNLKAAAIEGKLQDWENTNRSKNNKNLRRFNSFETVYSNAEWKDKNFNTNNRH